MSIFSSLNYLLIRAASAIKKPDPPEDELPQETKSSNNYSLTVNDDSSSSNNTSSLKCQHLLVAAFTFYMETEMNKTFDTTQDSWKNFIASSTSASKAEFNIKCPNTNKNIVHFSNETYPNAEHLLESWWNIFDARYLRHGWGLTVTLIIAYMLILVVGVIGNIMVILVVLLRPQMRSVTNMFIMNLAVADLFVIVFCVPSTLLANIFAPWILGTFMCKGVAYVQGVAVCAAAYSLAAISFDRCQAVYRSYERPRGFSRRTCAKTVILIWLAALSLTVPWAVVFEVKESEYDGLRYCVETWEDYKHGNAYFLVVTFACFYAIPFLLIFASNWIIYCHVAQRTVPHDSASSAPLRKLHRDTRRHVLKMLGIVTLTFLISWLPVYILVIIIKFSDKIGESEYKILGILMPIAQWLGTWNSSINPILYAFLNKKFRKMFRSILPAWMPTLSTRKDFVLSVKTPTFTTTVTEKSLRRGNTNSKIYDQNNEQLNSHYQANLLISKSIENLKKLAPITIKTVSYTILAAPVISVCTSVYNNDSGIIVAHL